MREAMTDNTAKAVPSARKRDRAFREDLERLEPNIPKSHLVAVVLEPNRARLAEFGIQGAVGRLSKRTMVDDRHAVLDDRDLAILADRSLAIYPGCMEGDIVRLPLFGRLARVLRLGLALLLGGGPVGGNDFVQGPASAIGIGLVHVGIEDLDLVTALDVDAAIGSGLAFRIGHGRQPKLDVELEIGAELLLGHDITLARNNL